MKANHPTREDIDLLAGEFYERDPQEEFAWLRANAPVYFDERHGVWGISKYHDVKAISRDPATWTSTGGIRPNLDPLPMMIDMDDPAHARRRKLLNKGFTPRKIRELEPKVRRACDEIIDAVIEKGEADFVSEVAALLPMVMIGDALGADPEHRATLLEWSDDMVKSQTSGATDAVWERAGNAFAGYQSHILEVVADRRTKPLGDDLMSVLVHAEIDGDKFTDVELTYESLLILIGGDETSRHAISGGITALLRHPDQLAKLQANRELIPSACEEMIRWVSPIKNMARQATRDVEYGGQQIDEGQKVLLLYPSANRDEEVFDNSQVFDIERTPNDHVAFGFGTHFCLGASLARMELRIIVEKVLDRLPDLRLTGDVPLRPANFVSGPEEMPVAFTPGTPVLT